MKMGIRDEISSAISRLGLRASELSRSEAHRLAARLEDAFGQPGAAPLWDRLKTSEGVHDRSAWARIAEFAQGPTNLLVLESHQACAFRFTSSAELVATLGACSGFEFYVADDDGRYLLAHNHHDVLIGSGTALDWIRSMRAEGSRPQQTLPRRPVG